jgi:hypothetical protein
MPSTTIETPDWLGKQKTCVFVGKRIFEFQGRQINHLRGPRKKGYWADGEGKAVR